VSARKQANPRGQWKTYVKGILNKEAE
jgi:hypothetical protein